MDHQLSPSQPHSLASSNHYFHLKVKFCEIFKSGDRLTDITYENSDHYQLWLWIGLVDQFNGWNLTSASCISSFWLTSIPNFGTDDDDTGNASVGLVNSLLIPLTLYRFCSSMLRTPSNVPPPMALPVLFLLLLLLLLLSLKFASAVLGKISFDFGSCKEFKSTSCCLSTEIDWCLSYNRKFYIFFSITYQEKCCKCIPKFDFQTLTPKND